MNAPPAPLTSKDLRAFVDAFSREALEGFHEFKEFKKLFYESSEQIDLLNACAKGFFADHFYHSLDRIVLSVSRLTDPQWQGVRCNVILSA